MARRPRLKLNVGEQINNSQLVATVLGYVLYKEYDTEDEKNYYFEEWELSGLVEFDSWIEYDHYSNKVNRYTPIRRNFKEITGGAVGVSAKGNPVPSKKKAKYTVATVTASEGNISYPCALDDQMQYVEVRSPKGKFVIERFSNGDVDLYRQEELTKAQQKELFGRVIAPSFLRRFWTKILMGTGVAFFVIGTSFGYPSYANECTPRSSFVTVDPTAELSDNSSSETQDSSSTCRRRLLWNSTGGSGAGK